MSLTDLPRPIPSRHRKNPIVLEMPQEPLPRLHCIKRIFTECIRACGRCRPRIDQRNLDEIEPIRRLSDEAASFVFNETHVRPAIEVPGEIAKRLVDRAKN